MRRPHSLLALALAALLGLTAAACGGDSTGAGGTSDRPSVVVTYSVLGSLVKDLVGDAAAVTVIMPNGVDPHDYQPSAKDVEAIMNADLLVQNGVGLEGGLAGVLGKAAKAGVTAFTASDHVDVRTVGEGEAAEPEDPDQQPGAKDPHLWMDPLSMKAVVEALALVVEDDLDLSVAGRAAELGKRLEELNETVEETLAVVPPERRKLVTGHETMGYFARRYGFDLIGAISPSLSTEAESSASELAGLESKIEAAGVPAIFTELGTPPDVARAVAEEAGVEVIEIGTANLPDDGSYFTFMRDISRKVADALQ